MVLEEGAEEEGEVLDEVLLIILTVLEGLSDVGGQWQHLHTRHKSKREINQAVCMCLYEFVYQYVCISM